MSNKERWNFINQTKKILSESNNGMTYAYSFEPEVEPEVELEPESKVESNDDLIGVDEQKISVLQGYFENILCDSERRKRRKKPNKQDDVIELITDSKSSTHEEKLDEFIDKLRFDMFKSNITLQYDNDIEKYKSEINSYINDLYEDQKHEQDNEQSIGCETNRDRLIRLILYNLETIRNLIDLRDKHVFKYKLFCELSGN